MPCDLYDTAIARGIGAGTFEVMATTDLTAKKRSDLRVAALHPAVAPTRDSCPPTPGGGAEAAEAELMPPPELLEQARALVARFDGLADRLPGQHEAGDVPVLADVLPMFDLPALPVDGETSQLDAKGRFACTDARALLGWEPQDLAVRTEGHWVVLTPTGELTTARGTARLNASAKVTLPSAQQRLLGVQPGRKVYVQPVPDVNALAVVNPAALLLGAPLSLIR